ncbi:MAG TPA: hypothetical protein VGE77_02350 [Nocardioides sp.]
MLSRVLEPQQLAAVAEMVVWLPEQPGRDFDRLPAGASEVARADVADRLLVEQLAVRERFPDLPDLPSGSAAARTVAGALAEIYNEAQLDVLGRVHRMRAAMPGRTSSHPSLSARIAAGLTAGPAPAPALRPPPGP